MGGGAMTHFLESKEAVMRNFIHRREFFEAAAMGAFGSFALGSYTSLRSEAQPAASPPRFFSGCCAYSYGKYLKSGQMTMEDFILKAVELRIEGVDITTYWLKSTEAAYLADLRHLGFKNGVCFSGVAIGAEMCQPDLAKRTATLENVKKWVDATELLGAPHLRVFGGKSPADATE